MKRILVIATRQIGDVLLTTPLIRAARIRWPDARIDVLGFEGQMGMLAGNSDINHCIPTPPRLGLAGTWRLARQLWRQYDLALVSQPGDRAHLLGWIAAPCRSGLIPEESGSNWWKRRLLRHAVKASGDRGALHVVPEKVRLLEPWPTASSGSKSATVVPPGTRQLPEDLAHMLRTGYLVIHAPSMWEYKQWPAAHWAALVAALVRHGHQVVLTGTAGERDQACIAPLRALATPPQVLDASGQLDFGQLRRLLEGAALYIGPDTSISHLAAACGTPCLAIFGPTNPQRWGPWPVDTEEMPAFERHRGVQGVGKVTLLQGPQNCVPCGRAGCEDHHHSRSDCLAAISPDLVLSQALAIIAKTNSKSPVVPGDMSNRS